MVFGRFSQQLPVWAIYGRWRMAGNGQQNVVFWLALNLNMVHSDFTPVQTLTMSVEPIYFSSQWKLGGLPVDASIRQMSETIL